MAFIVASVTACKKTQLHFSEQSVVEILKILFSGPLNWYYSIILRLFDFYFHRVNTSVMPMSSALFSKQNLHLKSREDAKIQYYCWNMITITHIFYRILYRTPVLNIAASHFTSWTLHHLLLWEKDHKYNSEYLILFLSHFQNLSISN